MWGHLKPGVKKIANNRCWQGCGENGTLIHCGAVNVYSIMENSIEIPQKNLKTDLIYNQTFSLLCMHSKKMKSVCQSNPI
jgi:hypothetical protein